VTFTYQGDVKKTIDILQSVLATEIVCVLRLHARGGCHRFPARCQSRFAQPPRKETDHMNQVAERINQLAENPTSTGRLGDARGVGIRQRGQLDRDEQGKSDADVSP